MGVAGTNPYTIIEVDLSDNTTVNSGGSSNTQTLQPSAGFAYEVLDMIYEAPDPAGSTANNQKVAFFRFATTGATYRLLYAEASTGNSIILGQYKNFVADVSELPSASLNQQQMLSNGTIWATNSNPITITYTNNTDANQTGTRTLKFLVKKHYTGGV